MLCCGRRGFHEKSLVGVGEVPLAAEGPGIGTGIAIGCVPRRPIGALHQHCSNVRGLSSTRAVPVRE